MLVLLGVGVGLERAVGAQRFGSALAGSVLAAMLTTWSLGVSVMMGVALSTLRVGLAMFLVLVSLGLRAVLPAGPSGWVRRWRWRSASGRWRARLRCSGGRRLSSATPRGRRRCAETHRLGRP